MSSNGMDMPFDELADLTRDGIPGFRLHGVDIPIKLNQDFITPDFERLMLFYPTYQLLAKKNAQVPFAFRPYMITMVKELVKRDARPGRTEQDWWNRIFEHFGLTGFYSWCKRYGE